MDENTKNYIDDSIRQHLHDGNFSQRINLFDIFGSFQTVTSAPTGVPKTVYGQFQIYDGALYYYDFVNNVWRSSSGALFDHYASVGNVTTGETDLYSDTIIGGTLIGNGDKLLGEYGGTFVSSGTATRDVRMYFAGTSIFDSGTLTLSLSSAWTMYFDIIRVNTTTVRYLVSFTTEGAALAAYTSVGEIVTSTTLTSGVNASTTTIPVTSGTNLSNGDYINIDTETLLITVGGGTNTLTATRAQNATVAASHSNGATVTRNISLSPNIIKITGQAAGVGAATNDIVAKLGYIERKASAT